MDQKYESGTLSRLPWIDILLLLVAAVWGGSYTAAKIAVQQLPVMEFLFLRFFLTFLLLLPAVRPVFAAQWRQYLAVGSSLGGILLAIFICETFGVALTTASNAAFLISLCVAFTPICEWLVLGIRPARSSLVAAGLSMAGAYLLSSQHTDGAANWRGDLLILAAALLRGLMVTMTRKFGGQHDIPALTVTAMQMAVMSLGCCVVLLLEKGTAWAPLPNSASFWWAMAFLILLCTLFAFYVQNFAAARTSPTRVSLLMGSEPMFGALIAWLLLGEALTVAGWLGAALILAATWLLLLPSGQTQSP